MGPECSLNANRRLVDAARNVKAAEVQLRALGSDSEDGGEVVAFLQSVLESLEHEVQVPLLPASTDKDTALSSVVANDHQVSCFSVSLSR
jgi:hypothetical protein